MWRNSSQTWGPPAKTLHWVMAALIFLQFVLGWVAASWRLSPMKLDLFVWHKSLGMTVLALVVLRLLWRAWNPPPALPADTNPWERRAARASHFLLYFLMLAMPLSGWVINSAANIPFKLFWVVPVPDLTDPNKSLADTAKLAHLILFWLLAALVSLHVAAALRHHMIKRNNVLRRMLPFGDASR